MSHETWYDTAFRVPGSSSQAGSCRGSKQDHNLDHRSKIGQSMDIYERKIRRDYLVVASRAGSQVSEPEDQEFKRSEA